MTMSMVKEPLGPYPQKSDKKSLQKQALKCIFAVTAKLSGHFPPEALSDL